MEQRDRRAAAGNRDRREPGDGDRWPQEIQLEVVGVQTDHPPMGGAERLLTFPALHDDLVQHAARAGLERPRRLHELAAIDAETRYFLAGQDVHLLELDRPDEGEQPGVSA